MASAASRPASWKLSVFVLALTLAVTAPAPTSAQEPALAVARSVAPSRVRAGDATAAALLRAGTHRSATFRAILDTIELSDVIVYVETRSISLPGQLQLLTAAPDCRHLRVSIRIPGLETQMIAWLGHELWHAVEIAGAQQVRDQASLLAFHKKNGRSGSSGATAETPRAQATYRAVLAEVRTGHPQ